MARNTPTIPAKTTRSRGRPPVISSQRLLEVAREVFLELGIRATTSEVASRAGVAEGTLFRRFKSKAELFRSAMKFDPNDVLLLVDDLSTKVGASDLRETLVDFAQRFMKFAQLATPVMMMSWSNPEGQLCLDRTSERSARYQHVLASLCAFFEAEAHSGRMRQVDSEVLARMLVGSIQHFCMIELFSGGSVGRLSHAEFARQVVDLLLAGAEIAPASIAPVAPSATGRVRKVGRVSR